MKTIILTGGGTAGHVMPHLAILDDLKRHFDNIVYIGSEGGIERNIIESKNIKYYPVTTVKFIRSFTLKNLLIPFKLIKGVNECKKIIKQEKPNVIFSKGGFVAVPVALAANSQKIPVIAHESDLTLGLANKIIYKKCKVMCTSFDTTAKSLKKGFYSGPPIRNSLFKGDKNRTNLNYDKNKKTLLVIGGSLGAKAINKVILESATEICKRLNIVHIVGKGNLTQNSMPSNYNQIEFTDKIEDIFALSDYVISRAGSNAIFEFLALKKPLLLIPLPLDQSRGDQLLNTEYLLKNNLALSLEQKNLNKENLINKLEELIKQENILKNEIENFTLPNGNKNLINQILLHSKN